MTEIELLTHRIAIGFGAISATMMSEDLAKILREVLVGEFDYMIQEALNKVKENPSSWPILQDNQTLKDEPVQ